MESLPTEEMLQEVLRELDELRRSLSALSKQVADLSAKVEAQQRPQTPPNVEITVSRLQEAIDKANSIVERAVEELAYQRNILLEELRRKDVACEALMERLAALQEMLEKMRK